MLRVVASSRTDRAPANEFENIGRSSMATGTIKRVVSDRGFGFIEAEDQKEYFFHRNSLEGSLDFDRLTGGERVEFEVEQSPKGPRANKVRAA
jgi:cold shock protein